MLDPYTYILLHKQQRREYMKQAEEYRQIQVVSYPALQLAALKELSHMIVRWWTQHRQSAEDNRVADGKVVLP